MPSTIGLASLMLMISTSTVACCYNPIVLSVVNATLTPAPLIFGIQIKNMEFFRYLFQNNVFEYIILGFALLTLIYLVNFLCCFLFHFPHSQRFLQSFCPSDRDYLNKVLHQITVSLLSCLVVMCGRIGACIVFSFPLFRTCSCT